MPLRELGPDITKQLFTDNWPIRRRWLRIGIIALSLNAEMLVAHIMWRGGNAIEAQVFMTIMGAAMTIFCGYVFAAVWDDNNKRQHWANCVDPDDGQDDVPAPHERPHLEKNPRPAGEGAQ